jgi:prophage regulatory protein
VGAFPRRFALCVVWDLAEVETWLAERKRQAQEGLQERAPAPDVRDRKKRPVRAR